MKSFDIEVKLSGSPEKLTVIPERSGEIIVYRLIKDGVEFCTLKENGDMGWEVNGTPLNADELNDAGRQIKSRSE